MHPTPRSVSLAHSALRHALGKRAPLRTFAGALLLITSFFGAQAASAAQERADKASVRTEGKSSARTVDPAKAPARAFELQAAVDDMVAALDLGRPGLEAVAAARSSGDKAAVRRALADYLRRREKPLFVDPESEAGQKKPTLSKDDRAAAERVLRHNLDSIGIHHQFGPRIDWHFDKTTEPGTTRARNDEWTWQLNRHSGWSALALAYRATGDEKYAREFVAQMTAWVEDCPRPKTSGNVARSAWRTIETGIRAASRWPALWAAFLRSPSMTDDALLTFLHAYREHALHLTAYHTTGNWLAMEGNGLFHVGVLFPEFRDAPSWRDTAAGWIHAELNNQVYPDGVQIELASGYHHVSLGNFLAVFKIARLNGVPLPADFLARLEKMYDFDVWGATPSRALPPVQDGGYYDVRKALAEASRLYPKRADFRWYATDGREGAPPAGTSHAFDWAGYYIMRSGWESDARWLLFDGGPFGYGHQHEDKLQIIVEAYGKRFLMDPGVYTYERSKWRSYFIDSHSHNVVLVDGQPQRRRGNKDRSAYIIKAPLPHVWDTNAASDYAEATFDEGFGAPVGKGVAHTRAVLFIKPGFWVVCDRLEAKDGKEHGYEALFHFDSPVKTAGTRVVTQNAGEANLTLAARPDAGLAVRLVEGQEEPVQGWLIAGSSKARPAPVAIYQARGATRHFLYAIVPAPKGAADPVRAVEPLDGDPAAARIVLADGSAYEVRFAFGRPAAWKKVR